MSEKKKYKQPEGETPFDNEQPLPETEAEKVNSISIEEFEALRQQLMESQAQTEEYKDGWQRAVAEFSNYRKRIERENEQVYQSAKGSIIKNYLPVIDDLERALSTCPAGLTWVEGIELIYRKLQSILESEGVTRIEAEGKIFDPNIHEAISQDLDQDHESGQVIEVVQQGYMLGDRVLRPARVRVAK